MERTTVDGVDYQLGADGQWYKVNQRSSGISGRTWLVVGVASLVFAATVGAALLLGGNQSDGPSERSTAYAMLDSAWRQLSATERLDVCTEVRGAGIRVSAGVFASDAQVDVAYVEEWLRDRCGD